MERATAPRTIAMAALLAVAATLLVMLCVLPSPVIATADDAVAYSEDNSGERTYYRSVDEAMSAAYAGREVFMVRDWELDTAIDVTAQHSVCINMNGHAIRSTSSTAAIHLETGANLCLTSQTTADFNYTGYNENPDSWEWILKDLELTSGGLVTDGNGAGIKMDDTSSLTLENVAIAGCRDSGVNTVNNASVAMKDGALITHNHSDHCGGGIYLKDDCSLVMSKSCINENFSEEWAGGVYVHARSRVTMNEESKIDGNEAMAGGGIFIRSNGCVVTSEDKTGSVSDNKAFSTSTTTSHASGGGIHVEKKTFGANECTIQGLTIANNCSDRDGGAVEVDQENVRLVDCAITGNTAAKDGGGVLVYNDDCSMTNCTITGNTAAEDGGGVRVRDDDCSISDCTITGNVCDSAGKNYEGGGVFVGYDYDIRLSGTCIIKGNTRGKNGSADDLFLSEHIGPSVRAFILGGVNRGSKVGVRTGMTEERKIAKNLSSNCYGAFFMDLPEYFVSYEHDDHGDMWQSVGSLIFTAAVNDTALFGYFEGSLVFADGACADASKHFWYWDAGVSTGFYPVSEYINDGNKYRSTFTYKMPQNDTNLKAAYADCVTKAAVDLAAPEAGKLLPTTAMLKRTDGGNGGSDEATALVAWYEVRSDGSRALVSGNAKPGTEYVASIYVPQDQKAGLFFNNGIAAEDVTVGSSSAASASVDSAAGALAVETSSFKTEGDAPIDDADGKLIVNLENGGLLGSADDSGKSTQDADSGSLTSVEFYYAKGSDSVTITAPELDGFNFCNWLGVEDGWINDDAEGIVTIPAEDLTDDLELTAFYTPVIAKIKLGLSAPKAGEKLANKATSLVAVGSDGETVDLMEALGEKKLSVEWTPGGKSAAYSTAYAAVVTLADAEGLEDPEGALSQDAVVMLSDGTQSTAASIAVYDGKICLLLLAPDTESVKAVKGLKAAKAGKGAVKVSWKKGNRSGVQVRYSTAKSMKGAKKATAKGKAAKVKTLKKLKSGKKYYFQARAYKVVNGKRCYSAWSKKVSVKVK